jgi:hypothetical protein
MNQTGSRRALLFASVSGMAAGGWWATALAFVSRTRTPVVEVTGSAESQLVIVDTGRTRSLIVIGESIDSLLNDLPRRMGLFRQRIDLLFATESALSTLPAGLYDRWRFGAVIALPGGSPDLPTRAAATIRDPTAFDLSAGVTLRCWPQYRSSRPEPTWRMEIERLGQVMALAASTDDLSMVPAPKYALAVAPHGSISLARRKSVAAAIALNARVIDRQGAGAGDDMILTRIFDMDVARFEMQRGQIRLPDWSIVPNQK